MAKLWVLSDLHYEVRENMAFTPKRPQADVVVVAGDVLESDVTGALELLDQLRGSMEAIFVAGNHEHWGTSFEAVAQEGKDAAARLGIHYLDDSFVDVAGLTFAGGTLWHPLMMDREYERPDLSKIMTDDVPGYGRQLASYAPFEEPIHIQGPDVMDKRAKNRHVDKRHREASQALRSQYADVIVTHYPPTLENLGSLPNASLWIHGHLHRRIKSRHGDTQIQCNPRGGYKLVYDFEPDLVVDVSRFGGR